MRAYYQWLRLRLLSTALSNFLVGFFVQTQLQEDSGFDPISLVLGLVATACLYCFGMGSNDFFDLQRDKLKQPKKPLASGLIQPMRAAFLLLIFAASAFCCASFVGIGPVIGVGLVLCASVGYNRFTKDFIIIGSINMGLVRGCLIYCASLFAGGSLAVSLPIGLMAAAVSIYGALITHYSHCEDNQQDKGRARMLKACIWALLSALAIAVLGPQGEIDFGNLKLTQVLPQVVAIALLAWWFLRIAFKPLRQDPPNLFLGTFRLLQAFYLLDLSLLLSYDQPFAAGVSLCFWLIAWRFQ